MKIFASKSTKHLLSKLNIAIGGGGVIDKAKIQSKKEGKVLLAIATTGAGATETSHAVVWGKTKSNVKTPIPISISCPFEIKLSRKARQDTDIDILCHLIDILQKCTDNDRVEIGKEVGRWLEKYGSGLTHKPSYEYTLKQGLTHGASLRKVIIPCIEKAYPIDK